MSRPIHLRPVPAVVVTAALATVLLTGAPAAAAPAGANDLILTAHGQLEVPPGHPPAMAPDQVPMTSPAAMPEDGMGDTLPENAAQAPANAAGPMYTARNMRDPFALPAEVRAPEAKREDVPPLERAPLSDFKLVAVVKKRSGTYAMVASSDGKGYTLGVGTRIGSDGGEVRRIMPDAVIVEQVRADEFGELKKSEIVLGLRPEEVVP